MRNFCVERNDAPNSLASLGETLGSAGVNIEGLCVTTRDGVMTIHFVVEDAVTARRVLATSGIRIRDESEVVIVDKDARQSTGRPGSFGGMCRTLADHGIRITFGYPAEHNRFVFGVDDPVKARAVLEGR